LKLYSMVTIKIYPKIKKKNKKSTLILFQIYKKFKTNLITFSQNHFQHSLHILDNIP